MQLLAHLWQRRPPTQAEIDEYERRKNLASLAKVPERLLTGPARDELVRRAASGQDTYAYQPACALPDEWNIWTDKTRYSVQEWSAKFNQHLA